MSAKPVLLRAASGPRTGLGHAMRSLAVALEVVRQGGAARVVVDDAGTARALAERSEGASLDVRVADDGLAWLEPSARSLWLDGFRPWERELRVARAAGVATLLVENRVADRDRAGLVLYPALHHEHDAWDRAHAERVLSGPGWIPLRRGVVEARARVRDVDLLVTFGGSDPHDLTGRVLRALAGSDERVVVSLGALMTARRAGYEDLLARLPRAELLPAGAELAPWMARARAAVTALGTTLYELAFQRVPALVLANHAADGPALDWYARNGPHIPLGVAERVDDADLRGALRRTSRLEPCERPSGLGAGAARLAARLLGE